MTENVREDVIYEEPLSTRSTVRPRPIAPLRQDRRNNDPTVVQVLTPMIPTWRPRLRDGFVRDSFAPEPEDRRRRRRDEDDEEEMVYSQRRTRRNRRNIQNFTQSSASFIPVAIHVHIPTPIIIPVSVPVSVNIPAQQPAPVVQSESMHPVPYVPQDNGILEEEEAEVEILLTEREEDDIPDVNQERRNNRNNADINNQWQPLIRQVVDNLYKRTDKLLRSLWSTFV